MDKDQVFKRSAWNHRGGPEKGAGVATRTDKNIRIDIGEVEFCINHLHPLQARSRGAWGSANPHHESMVHFLALIIN